MAISEDRIARASIVALFFLLGVICFILGEQQAAKDAGLSIILQLVGGFLVVSIPVELIKAFMFDNRDRLRNIEDIEDIFDRKVAAILLNAKRYGLELITAEIDMAKLFGQLQPGLTLWWLDTFAPAHQGWIEHVEAALKRGAKINMLILDPSAPAAAFRAEELGGYYTFGPFTREIKSFTEDFRTCSEKDWPGRLEIRLYTDLLGVPAYVVTRDSRPLWGYSSFYLRRPTGVAFPHFKWVEAEEGILQPLFAYIEAKWIKFHPVEKLAGSRSAQQSLPSSHPETSEAGSSRQ